MDKTYFLTQSTSLILVITISLIFAFLGIFHSKKFKGINNYLTANRNNLNSLKSKTSSEWREYATQCMIEIMSHKS